MPRVKINEIAFKREIYKTLTPTTYEGFRQIANKKACWGIKGNGDLPLIMGVLNFGDPDHRFLNNAGGASAPIPPRPWLSRSTQGIYQTKLNDFIRKHGAALVASVATQGKTKFKATSGTRARTIHPDDFLKGLSELGRDLARYSWEKANFQENSDVTLARKTDPRPLHDTGRMNESVIEAWVE